MSIDPKRAVELYHCHNCGDRLGWRPCNGRCCMDDAGRQINEHVWCTNLNCLNNAFAPTVECAYLAAAHPEKKP